MKLSVVSGLVAVCALAMPPAALGQTLNWSQIFDPTLSQQSAFAGAAVDSSNNVFAAGYAGYGSNGYSFLVTVKYDSTGAQTALAKYSKTAGGGYGDGAVAIALDSSDNVYVAGVSAEHFALVKYDDDLNEVWHRTYTSGGSRDALVGMALDSSANIYLTGTSSVGVGTNALTVKYDTNGNKIWVRTFANMAGSVSSAAITVGGGNVYVAGTANNEYLTIEYNSSGVEQWHAYYTGGYGRDNASALTVDGSGNVYVTGASRNVSGYLTDYATVAYNSAGVRQWIRRYSILAAWDKGAAATAIALDSSGNVIVGGGASTGPDSWVTIAYNAVTGAQTWRSEYWGVSYHSAPAGFAFDGTGDIYVAGGTGNPLDYSGSGAVLKLDDATGAIIWSRASMISLAGLALDAMGNIDVAGGGLNNQDNADAFAGQYSP